MSKKTPRHLAGLDFESILFSYTWPNENPYYAMTDMSHGFANDTSFLAKDLTQIY